MKSVFDRTTRDELISRVNALRQNSPALWGKMSVFQMVRHCALWDEMVQGTRVYPRALLGRLFGKMALKSVLKAGAPLRRNTPTLPELKISGEGDVNAAAGTWAARIKDYEAFSNDDFVHPFFGKITREQIGYVAYKHADHHLSQFGV